MDKMWMGACSGARFALGVVFVVHGWLSVPAWSEYYLFMQYKDLLLPIVLGVLLVLQVAGGLALMLGYQAPFMMMLPMILILVPGVFMFLGFWSPPAGYQEQMAHSLKTVAILGILLLLVERGYRRGTVVAATE